MKVLVSDTSIIVDLERGGLLEATFKLPLEFVVPDLLFEREMREYGGYALIEMGLQVQELSEEAVSMAIQVRREKASLSLPDSFAFVLAKTNAWTLLTGDGGLRELALGQSVDCHGVLWVIDEIERAMTATYDQLNTGLTTISKHERCRLPPRECKSRLERYVAQLVGVEK